LNIIDEYIAPWALPHGPIPFHCLWEPIDALRKICFTLPGDYNIIENLNFSSYNFDSESRVVSILSEDLKSDNYFGAVMTYNKILETIERSDEIIISYLDKDDIELSNIILHTRVVRPLLILQDEDIPAPIIIDDKTDLKKILNLDIMHKGFGTATIEVKISQMGHDITKYSSLYFEMMEKMYESITPLLNIDSIDDVDSVGLDEEMLQTLHKKLMNVIEEDKLPNFIKKENIDDVRRLLNDPIRREKLLGILIQNINTVFMTTLLWYNDRNPREDVKLLWGNMAANLSGKIEELNIEISYQDSMNNKYGPLNMDIKVLDSRTTTTDEIEIPININWRKDVLEL